MTKAVTRTAKGTFVKGVSGNDTGLSIGGLRAKQQIVQLKENLELAVRQGPLNANRVCGVINKMLELAEKGDVKAAKLIIALAVSGSAVNNDADNKTPPQIVIRVENATFKATAAELPEPIKLKAVVVDAEFQEVKSGQGT